MKIEQPILYSGTVLWFNGSYGYGFAECIDFGTRNIFCHFERIISTEPYKTLAKGQYLEFEVVETAKGLMAVNIRERKIIKVRSSIVEQVINQ